MKGATVCGYAYTWRHKTAEGEGEYWNPLVGGHGNAANREWTWSMGKFGRSNPDTLPLNVDFFLERRATKEGSQGKGYEIALSTWGKPKWVPKHKTAIGTVIGNVTDNIQSSIIGHLHLIFAFPVGRLWSINLTTTNSRKSKRLIEMIQTRHSAMECGLLLGETSRATKGGDRGRDWR